MTWWLVRVIELGGTISIIREVMNVLVFGFRDLALQFEGFLELGRALRF